MTYTVRLAPAALLELGEAAGWYEAQRTGLGDEFIDAVESASRGLAQWPEAGTPVASASALQLRRVRVEGFPYHLPYRVHGDMVDVLAVAHDRRRPLYWADRTTEES